MERAKIFLKIEDQLSELIMSNSVEEYSTITCPSCEYESTQIMASDACLYFWQCPNCSKILKPRSGDCCVYCSYGSVPCPPFQSNECSG